MPVSSTKYLCASSVSDTFQLLGVKRVNKGSSSEGLYSIADTGGKKKQGVSKKVSY